MVDCMLHIHRVLVDRISHRTQTLIESHSIAAALAANNRITHLRHAMWTLETYR